MLSHPLRLIDLTPMAWLARNPSHAIGAPRLRKGQSSLLAISFILKEPVPYEAVALMW